MAALIFVYGVLFRVISQIFWSLDVVRCKILNYVFPKCTDQSRKLRILARDTVSHIDASGTDLNNFIVWSEANVDKDYILKPEVSLYTFTTTHAVFIELPKEHSTQIYNVKKHAFMYKLQYDYSRSLIFMPLKVFHEVAENIGDPKYPFVYLPSTGRCGSTLVSNIFNALPKCLSISEPDCLLDILSLYEHAAITKDDMKQLVKNSIIYLLKSNENEFALIKPRSQCSVLMSIIVEVFPSNPMPVVYMYRNGLDVLRSFNKIFQQFGMDTLPKQLKERLLFPFGCGEYKELKNLKDSEFGLDNPDHILFIQPWAITNAYYLFFHREFPERARSLSYDLLIANPEKVLEDLLDTCGLSKDYLPLAMKEMSRDSQEGTLLSTRNKAMKKKPFSDDDMAKIVEILENIPCVSTDLAAILPGDISGDI